MNFSHIEDFLAKALLVKKSALTNEFHIKFIDSKDTTIFCNSY